MTDTPTTLTKTYLVSRYSVRIALTDILLCDIQNVYLTAKCRENIWPRAGPDFESEARTIMIVKMALYGLNYSSAAFSDHLDETLNDIRFLSTKADPDLWYRPAVKPNGFEYYDYILCYVDDILCISHDPGISLRRIQAVSKFKRDKMEHPEIYLGSQVRNMTLDGAEVWCMSAENYVRDAVENVEQNLEKSKQGFPTCCKTPIMSCYRP